MLQTQGFKKKILVLIIFLGIAVIINEGIAQTWWFQIENCEEYVIFYKERSH